MVSVHFAVLTRGLMEITTKELRIHPGRILQHVQNGDEIYISYRGKRIAKLVPIEQPEPKGDEAEMFGLWSDSKSDLSVEDTVREMRKGRTF